MSEESDTQTGRLEQKPPGQPGNPARKPTSEHANNPADRSASVTKSQLVISVTQKKAASQRAGFSTNNKLAIYDAAFPQRFLPNEGRY